MKKHLKNMTSYMIQREFGSYRMISADAIPNPEYKENDDPNYNQYEYTNFAKRAEEATKRKNRLRESKRIKYLEQKVRHLEKFISKEGLTESPYFFWFILFWASFKLIYFLRYTFAWLYQKRVLNSATSLTMHSPLRPVTRRLNRMFQSFIMEKASSITKAEDD